MLVNIYWRTLLFETPLQVEAEGVADDLAVPGVGEGDFREVVAHVKYRCFWKQGMRPSCRQPFPLLGTRSCVLLISQHLLQLRDVDSQWLLLALSLRDSQQENFTKYSKHRQFGCFRHQTIDLKRFRIRYFETNFAYLSNKIIQQQVSYRLVAEGT